MERASVNVPPFLGPAAGLAVAAGAWLAAGLAAVVGEGWAAGLQAASRPRAAALAAVFRKRRRESCLDMVLSPYLSNQMLPR